MPPVSPSQGIVRKISSMIRSMESRIARPELRNRGLNIQDRESRGEGIVIGGVSVGREVLPATPRWCTRRRRRRRGGGTSPSRCGAYLRACCLQSNSVAQLTLRSEHSLSHANPPCQQLVVTSETFKKTLFPLRKKCHSSVVCPLAGH